MGSAQDEGSQPTAEELLGWRDEAEKYLAAGVAAVDAQTPADVVSEDLIRGKIALATVRNLKGHYTAKDGVPGAVELLTAEPHPVVKAVEPPAGEARPNDSSQLTSRSFAGIVYRTLLRAYIGAKDVDAARSTMKTLEEVGGKDDSAALTQTFIEFGRQLQSELEQLESSGEGERLGEVRSGFESFLGDLASRDQSQQTFNSLNWIAETYLSLAEGSSDNLIKQKDYFAKAADAYQKIVGRGDADPAFYGSPQNAVAVKVRMLEARLSQDDYEGAEATLFEVLKTASTAPNVQQTAARLYQRWAESGDSSKYQYALHGRKEPGEVWGWGGLAQKMQGQSREDLKPLFYEASEQYARTALAAARTETGEDRQKMLSKGVISLETVGRTTRNIPDDVFARLDSLYGTLLTELGEPVAQLPRGGVATAGGTAVAETSRANTTGAAPTAAAEPEEEPANPNNLGNIVVVAVLLVIGLAAVAGIFMWTTNQSKKQRAAKLAAIASAAPKPKRPKTKADKP
ncbi:MAG: hypothetical protein R3B90_17070 [Planctomycetaceae bacterium]